MLLIFTSFTKYQFYLIWQVLLFLLILEYIADHVLRTLQCVPFLANYIAGSLEIYKEWALGCFYWFFIFIFFSIFRNPVALEEVFLN